MIRDRDPNRPRWSELQDTSAEDLDDLRDSPDVPAPPLHSNSYIETPEPSFDLEDGGVSARLQHATALHGQPTMMDIAALSNQLAMAQNVQVVSADPAAVPCGEYDSNGHVDTSAAISAEGFPIKSHLSAGAPEFFPMQQQAITIAIPTEVVEEEETQADDEAADNTHAAATPTGTGAGHVRHRIRGKRRPPPSQTAAPVSSRQKRRRNDDDSEETRGGEMPEATEEEWQKRIAKRQAVVENTKDTAEYKAMAASRTQSQDVAAPTTPDYNDRSISKRTWEKEVMQWRTAVRQWPGPPEAN